MGQAQQAAPDIPKGQGLRVQVRRQQDKSLTLCDLPGTARAQAGLRLGNVNDELSTATKDNNPHSCAWVFKDKLTNL